jgi:hypothetical protein
VNAAKNIAAGGDCAGRTPDCRPCEPRTPTAAPNGVAEGISRLQTGEDVNWTLNSQLGLEHHGGRIPSGLWARIIQRLLALNAAIWHNWLIGGGVKRSLIAYDHLWPARIFRSTI